MSTTAQLVAEITAAPAHVLFLDTCVVLDTIRAHRDYLGKQHVVACKELLTPGPASPPAVHLVVGELVAIEFGQNEHAVRIDSRNAMEVFQRVYDVGVALAIWGTTAPNAAPITDDLVLLAQNLLARSKMIDGDSTCLGRAMNRVVNKRRPAQSGRIKDAFLLEQYLEFSRQLRATGFSMRCAFASTNTEDYAENRKARIHPDLEVEFLAVGLEYFNTLHAAVGSLGLLSGAP
jgi:hypothetical protein